MVKNIFRWIDGGELMEKWGMNAFELRQLIYDGYLEAYDAETGKKFVHITGPNAWMAGPPSIVKQTLKEAPLLPIDEQKKALSAVIFFKPVDVEKFEKEHPDLLQKNDDDNTEKLRLQPSPSSTQQSFDSKQTKDSCDSVKDITSIKTFKFSEDFSAINYQGQQIALTSYQAETVKLLYDAHEMDLPGLSQHYILEKINSDSNSLKDLFKSRKNEVWGKDKLIVPVEGKRGFFRLNL